MTLILRILNLNLKGAIKFEVDTSKSRKEEIKIIVARESGVDLNEDEIVTIRFLKKIRIAIYILHCFSYSNIR